MNPARLVHMPTEWSTFRLDDHHTIEVAPRLTNLDDVMHLSTITTWGSRSSRLKEHAQYVYSGPLQPNSSLGQLVRSNVNFSIDLLNSLCRAHNVQGYSKPKPLLNSLFLNPLLWSCKSNCNACSNGYVFKRRQAPNAVAPPRRLGFPDHRTYALKPAEVLRM
ncbi:BQ2448_7505 [Microbotryum intermedium]|uniref:BQ2448_7505 protein n=1 Tax=Microbotryum intermedium TaxID=269621 RepID=A0A238FLC7_9BASI|nr:BQ2448_7505 [Microbotryum intermedium]